MTLISQPEYFKAVKTSTRVVHRCVRTNISAIPDIFGEMNEIYGKHVKICLRYARA